MFGVRAMNARQAEQARVEAAVQERLAQAAAEEAARAAEARAASIAAEERVKQAQALAPAGLAAGSVASMLSAGLKSNGTAFDSVPAKAAAPKAHVKKGGKVAARGKAKKGGKAVARKAAPRSGGMSNVDSRSNDPLYGL